MLENTALKIASGKFAIAPLLPGSLIIISGIVVWKLWRKQVQLQAETNELSNELKNVKKQMAKIKATNKVNSESVAPVSPSLKKMADLTSSIKKMAPLSSSLKKMDRFNPWSKAN